jgi:cytidyltransferase-like protein
VTGEVVGHVHGRFQPFHEEHLAYAAWAAGKCDRLIVGITNADPAHVTSEDADPKRHQPRHNPFRYHERHRMVRAAVDDAAIGVPVRIMPFPINRPELWADYAPRDAVHFVNVLEEWHEVKADRLRDRGRTVRTKRGTRTVSGTEIKRRMAAAVAAADSDSGSERADEDDGEGIAGTDDDWRAGLPSAVVAVLREIDGLARVREL